MKKYIQIAICFLIGISIMWPIQPVKAETATDEKWFSFDRSYGRITAYNPTDDPTAPTEVVIPSTIKGDPVRELGLYAFQYKEVTKVVVADSITQMYTAFADNPNLTTIVLGKGITKLDFIIGEYLPAMTSFTVPGTIKSMATTMPFVGCDDLTEMIFEEGFQSIESANMDDFDNMSTLKKITLPSTMTSINPDAFGKSPGLTDIVIHQTEAASPLATTAPWGAANATVTWDSGGGTPPVTPTTAESEVIVSYDNSNKIPDPDHPSDAKWSVVIPKSIDLNVQGKSANADITLRAQQGGVLPSGDTFINVSVKSMNGYALKLNSEAVNYTMSYDDQAGIQGILNQANGNNKVLIGSLQDGQAKILSTVNIVGNATSSGSYTDTLTYTIESVTKP